MVDSVMQEVYDTRQRLSGSFGHNISRYLEGLKILRENARRGGYSLAEYCIRNPIPSQGTIH